jgi:hypothetical protein
MKQVLLVVLITACGSYYADSKPRVTKIKNCTVEETEDGALIQCPDGTSVVVTNGADGQDGTPGQDGQDGQPGTVDVVCTIKEVE